LVEPIKFDTPVIAYGLRIEQAWFDASGSLSVWGMTRVFDRIAASGFDILDCGEAYRARSGCAMAQRRAMTTYLEPVRQATPLLGAFRLLDASASGLHVYLEICDALGRRRHGHLFRQGCRLHHHGLRRRLLHRCRKKWR
jgi:acyl-CoA thioesterase FadM